MVESRENILIFVYKIGSDFVIFDVLRKIRIEYKLFLFLKFDWFVKVFLSVMCDEFNV